MILITASSALHGKVLPSELTDAGMAAMSLEKVFGTGANVVFAFWILAGALSSFIVNALIGGVVFCDSVGWNCKLSSREVRVATVIALLLGWAIASSVSLTSTNLVSFIMVTQSLTMLCFPILAAVLVWQLGKLAPAQLPFLLRPLVWCGLLVVVILSARTLYNLIV